MKGHEKEEKQKAWRAPFPLGNSLPERLSTPGKGLPAGTMTLALTPPGGQHPELLLLTWEGGQSQAVLPASTIRQGFWPIGQILCCLLSMS